MDDLEFEETVPPPTQQLRQVYPADIEAHEEEQHPEPFPIVPARRAYAAPLGRNPPASLDAEEYLLSCCLLDGRDMVYRCRRARISPDSFHDPKHGIIFACILSLYAASKPIDVSIVAEELKATRQLDAVGGYAFLTQVSSRIPTTAQAGYFIDKVREQALLREIIRSATGIVEDCYNFSGGIDEFAAEAKSKIADVVRSASEEKAAVAFPITRYEYPKGDDPNILLGADDYLGRGGGMLFVSHAGAGKSSFLMDALMSWALGRPWMGIRSNGALKSLIIQAEDSDRYIGKVAASFASCAKLTPAEIKKVGENCVIAKVRGICGPMFFSEVERLAELHKPDIVAINPVYLYAEGDIAKSEYAQPFLVGLDRANPESKFAYILTHHTGKPEKKGNNGKRSETEDWETIYMGFGSSYLANWPRCSALLEPRAGEPGKYTLKLGKAGMNAGVTKPVPQGAGFRDEPTTRINLRHSVDKIKVDGRERNAIFWVREDENAPVEEQASQPAEPAAPREAPLKRPRAKPFVFPDIHSAIARQCTGELKRQGFNVLHRAVNVSHHISKGLFNDLLKEGVDSGVLKKHEDGRYFMP